MKTRGGASTSQGEKDNGKGIKRRHSITKKQTKAQRAKIIEDELLQPIRSSSRSKAADKSAVQRIKDYCPVDFKVAREACPYDETLEHGELIEGGFYNAFQKQIFDELYFDGSTYKFGKQCTIDLVHMCKDRYFEEAYELCEKFGLIDIMEFRQDFNPFLIAQFFATIHWNGCESFYHMDFWKSLVQKYLVRIWYYFRL